LAAAVLIGGWYSMLLFVAGVGLATCGTVAPGGLLCERLLANGGHERVERMRIALLVGLTPWRRRLLVYLGIWVAVLGIAVGVQLTRTH
jgi:polyferredoxin